MSAPLLQIEDLVVEVRTARGPARAIDGVSLEIERGQTLGLVGESGCGKSLTALSVLRLLGGGARIAGGRIRFEGRDLLELGEREMRRLRGARIAMVFQEPMSALNPVLTIGAQVAEALTTHGVLGRAAARTRAVELLELVEIPDAARRAGAYPHELSGGMRQRVVIAMAISCEPALLLADEPTTALDVTIQAQILELLRQLRGRLGMSLLLITHDLGVVAAETDEVAIMYSGRIVERAPVRELFAAPAHPYTAGLLASLPALHGRAGRLASIAGTVPEPLQRPPGCRFRDRCQRAEPDCEAAEPRLAALHGGSPARSVACRHPLGTGAGA